MSSVPLRIYRFSHPEEFLEATKLYDDSWMNYAIGTLLDERAESGWSEDEERVLIGVYKGENLLLTFTHNASDSAWILCIVNPGLGTGGQLSREGDKGVDVTDFYKEAVDLIIGFLQSVPFVSACPSKIYEVFGEADLVEGFCKAWARYRNQEFGKRAEGSGSKGTVMVVKKLLESRVGWVAKDTLPTSSTSATLTGGEELFEVVRADSEGDVDELARLYVQFKLVAPDGAPSADILSEQGRREMREAVGKGDRAWFCRPRQAAPSAPNPNNGTEIVGYVLSGRITPNTASIQNVFVLPKWRKRGIAERLVGVVSRYWLEGERGKKEVSLNVAEEHPGARRIYKRCGFAVDDKDLDENGVLGKRCYRKRKQVVVEEVQS